MAKSDLSGLGRLIARVEALRRPDPRPLLRRWEEIIDRDNERGVLAGTDKDGHPADPLRFRPVIPKGRKGPARWTAKQQAAKAAGTPEGNNLTPAQYRKLAGPRDAPRGRRSRVITNLFTGSGWDDARGEGFAEGTWVDVVDRKGREFLSKLFAAGKGRRAYDLRGVRPWGRQQALKALRDWARSLLGQR